MQQLRFYWVVPAYHSEFGLVTICLKACSTILIARESICKDRQFLSTSEEAALIIFTCKPTKVELVQIKNARQLEVMIKYTFFLSGIGQYTKNQNPGAPILAVFNIQV